MAPMLNTAVALSCKNVTVAGRYPRLARQDQPGKPAECGSL